MSEESRSIWKRPIKGWRLLAARLVVLISLTVVLALLVRFCLVPSSPPDLVRWSCFIGIALLLVLGCLFGHRLFCWRNLRRLLIGLACLVTLVALFYAEENFRGKRAWEKYRQEAEARGEQLDFKAFIPKPVPDDQNFAATALIKSWFVRTNGSYNLDYWKEDTYGQAESRIDWTRPVDLVAWKQAFDAIRTGQTNPSNQFASRGRDQKPRAGKRLGSGKLDQKSRAEAAPSVLEALKTNEAIFKDLRDVRERLFSRYPVEYDSENPSAILLPHLNSVRAVCKRLSLKACAELAVGKSEDALEDIRLSLHMADSLKGEPIFISYLVRIACMWYAIQPIGEGLAEHAWSDAQLQEIQTRLQQYGFIGDLKRSLEAERAAGIAMIDYVRKRGLDRLGYLTGDWPSTLDSLVASTIGPLIPRGWYYQEQLNYCRLFQILSGTGIDTTNKHVSPSQVASNSVALDRAFAGRNPFDTIFVHHRLMSTILLPSLGNALRKAASAQIAVDEALLACTLERYRLANGQFPDKLDALVPQFIAVLPNDPITGEPYKYRRTENGQFILYSVGWNETDDGGVPGKTDFDEKNGDWVWQYPTS